MNNSFIFVRHGQSQANADTVIADAYSPLTEAGIEQARKTAEEVRKFDITLIACSPYLRARQTAETIAEELGIDISRIQIIDDLHERGLGILENQHREHEGVWYFTDDSSEGVEPRVTLLERMTRCIQQIKEVGKDQNLLVVGHAVSGFYLTQVSKGNTTLDQFESPALMSNADFIQLNYL